VRSDLTRRGYKLEFTQVNSGPITAIYVDREHGSRWGAAAYHGEDSGIAW
jgi:gamma-glutamyltranspeptidase/glutathione hydrolase